VLLSRINTLIQFTVLDFDEISWMDNWIVIGSVFKSSSSSSFGLVGDIAVPMSARQVVLSCACIQMLYKYWSGALNQHAVDCSAIVGVCAPMTAFCVSVCGLWLQRKNDDDKKIRADDVKLSLDRHIPVKQVVLHCSI